MSLLTRLFTMPALPPIYCLTLAEEPHKRAALEAHLTSQSIDATYLQGFYGATLGIKSTNPFAIDKNGTAEYIHINTLGCYLSHLLALRTALADNHDEFIILEDDAMVCPEFAKSFAALRDALPPATNLVNLECFESDLVKPREPINAYCQRIFWPFGAAGIWWRRDAAEIAVRHLHPINAPYDIALMSRVYPFCDVAVATPSLVRQRTAAGDWPSTIHNAVIT